MTTLSDERLAIREALARLIALAFPYWTTNMVRYAVAVYYKEVDDDDGMREMIEYVILGKYDGHQLLPNDSGLPDLRN